MPKLILVRHSEPATDACVAPNQWPLSEVGRKRSAELANVLARYFPAVLYSSREAKAVETAALVGRQLGVPYTAIAGLQEHSRTSAGWLSAEEYRAGMEALFARPAETVFGDQSADQAYERFAATVNVLLERHPEENLVVVTHGTVITLLIQRNTPALDPLQFWQKLGLPAVVVLSRPELALEQLIEKVEI